MFFKKTNLLAFLLAVVVLVTLSCVTVFATEADSAADTAEATTVADATTADDATTAAETATTAEASEETTAAADTESKSISTGTIVGLIITGVLVAIIVVIIVTKRSSIGPFFRGLASEVRTKIVWSSWKDSRKNTIVVIVITLALAIVIWLLDTAFWEGIMKLADLAEPLKG